MNKAVVSIALLLVSLFVFANQSAQAAEPKAAATEELPLAFRSLDGDTSQILNEREAEEIRGQWWIFIPLQAGDVFYHGVGSGFAANLYTESESYPPYNVGWRITIGR
jgi:hypothetical protein